MRNSLADFREIPAHIWVLLSSRAMASAATVGLTTIVGKQVFDITGDPLSLGVLGLVEFLPTALLSPFSGSVADRFDRRIVGALGSAGVVLVSISLFALVSADISRPGPIYVLMFLYGSIRAFERPAVRALPVDLAPPSQVERVVALSTASWQLGTVIGPALAGLLFTVDITLPYLVIAVLYVLAAVALLSIPAAPILKLDTRGNGARQAFRDAFEGFRFIRRTPILAGAISLDLFAVLLGGAVALLPAIAEDRLGVDAFGLGLLRSAVAVGAGLVTLSLAFKPITRHVGKILLTAVGAFGVATIALGLTTNFSVALAVLVVLGGFDSISVYVRSTLVPLATPENMRGRVLALDSVFIGASNELGAFESGVTAAWFGLVGAILFGGFGTVAVVTAYWFLFPALRDVDRFSDAMPNRASAA